jgi:hypothetical protein
MTSRLKSVLLALGMGTAAFFAASVEADESNRGSVIETSTALTIDANGLHLAAHNRRLDTLLAELAQNSGIEFVRPEGLEDHPVTARADAADWASIIRAALQGFNHVVQLNRAGTIERVVITGLNGDGADSGVPGPSLFTEVGAVKNSTRNTLPPDLAQLPRKAVRPIRLDRARMMAMKFGEELPLSLPSGQQAFVHDNRYAHENGDITWVGYLKADGQAFRAVMTFGETGVQGQISTPEALYQIEPGSGLHQWLVDIQAAGLSHSPHHSPEPVPAWTSGPAIQGDKPEDPEAAQAADAASGGPTANPDSGASTPTTIDLLVLYTPKLASGKAITRINQLIALTNQSFVDSRIAISLRLVKSLRVDYPEAVDNGTALRDLTLGRGVFRNVVTWRRESGADLVTLIRPFEHTAQKGCGSAWLNGADGQPLSSNHAFSVVNDGRSGLYYCSDYALAHELAHTMGSAHDRVHAGVGGVFPYSHGHSVPGSFGTIMSYTHPRLGLFSNPHISQCRGAPCGLDASGPAAADNAQSLNAVRALVAGFRPAVR